MKVSKDTAIAANNSVIKKEEIPEESKTEESSEPEDDGTIHPMRIVQPGTLCADFDTGMAAVNEKLKKESQEKLAEMMDAETWLTAAQCVEYGLADRLADQDADMSKASAILQQVNTGLEQRLHYQQELAAQLRELVKQPSGATTEDPEPQQGAESPEKNKILSLFV